MIKNLWAITAMLLLLVSASTVRAAEVPPFVGRITDAAGILKQDEYLALNSLLADYEQKTTNQLFILTIKSLEGENIEEFSHRAFRAYKVGQKGSNNGVLLIVALDDRKMRIEVGYGLEGVLPDGRAGQIQREVISPYFKQGKYSEGIEAGVREIIRVISPDYKLPEPAQPAHTRSQPRPKPVEDISLLPLAIIGGGILLVIGIVAFTSMARKKRCPRCHSWGKQVTQSVIEAPTLFSSGYNRMYEFCPSCGYSRESYYNTPAQTGGVIWGGGGGYWGGSSGSSGSNFGSSSDFGSGGGGDSGGGGASSDW